MGTTTSIITCLDTVHMTTVWEICQVTRLPAGTVAATLRDLQDQGRVRKIPRHDSEQPRWYWLLA
jgi:DNA-binding IclR family transcriptional regulator